MQDDVAGCFEYYADLAEKQGKQPETSVELPMSEFTSVIRHEPLGPVALISSFNYPMLIATVRCPAAGVLLESFQSSGMHRHTEVQQMGSPVHEPPAEM